MKAKTCGLFIILVVFVVGCNQSRQSSTSQDSINKCGNWPDKNYTVVSGGVDFPIPYQNSKFIGISKNIFSLNFYCSSDSPDTIGNFFKSNDYYEISNFQDHDPLGYNLVKEAAGARNFKVFINEKRKIKPFSTLVLFESGSGKNVIAAYH